MSKGIRQIAAIVISLLAFTGCENSQTESGKESEKKDQHRESASVQEVLSAFRRTVEKELLPRIDELDHCAFGEEAARLFVGHIADNKKVFAKEAERILANLPRLELGDQSEWEPLYPDSEGVTVIPPTPTTEPSQEIENFVCFWHPVVVARLYREPSLMHMSTKEAYAKRHLIEQIAPPRVMAVDPEPSCPVIAFFSDHEVFLVSLHRRDDGAY